MARRDDIAARDFEAVADELYTTPPQEFIALRDAHAKAAKDRGDRASSAQIGALRKPSIGAWTANQLVRARPAEIDSLLQLGAGLRKAQNSLDGDELRVLSQQRRQLINSLVRQARQIAAAQQRPINEQAARDVAQTLEAALSDDDAATQLRAARLTVALTPSADFGSARTQLRAVGGPLRERAARHDIADRDVADHDIAERAVERDVAERDVAERDVAQRAAERESLIRESVKLDSRALDIRARISALDRELREVEDTALAMTKKWERNQQLLTDAVRRLRATRRAPQDPT
jgi:hypothetical protein